ncbi:relaxase/mobilization nuclease domain-containing protein [Dyadobacter subterraneus]|uniref:Relaxase/mobilization nuclease domain-containing protein n=1 Tax=Dyadobacter subterraneus TaxID=2773304 RepID=A0ABR9WJ83_9BACT|nr:relaxase/mobilization nuclease domain-containing protein [Dyadobacter subterraneus]MBE9465505.1 relaxase/mobilization nuclease domain-containing protein [Dyadobacter subterraneus]
MIGKVGLGRYAKGILQYCYYDKQLTAKQISELGPKDVRGELVYIQNLALQKLPDGRFDINNLSKQFLDNSGKNRRLTKFIWHQSFSFAPGENPGNDKITQIAMEFAKDFGFEDNQMAVFLHTDKAHRHFHIAANRINYNGKNTADHFNNYARVGKFCRKMELELGLQITPEMHLTAENKDKPRQTADQALLKLKNTIDSILPNVSTMQQLSTELQKQGVKTFIKRGVTFINTKNGMKVKGSDIGREYSFANLEKRLGVIQTMEKSKSAELSLTRQRKRGLSI